MLHAVVGVLVRDGRIDPSQTPQVPSWTEADDPRRSITWNDLLHMRSGLQWVEEYYDFDWTRCPTSSRCCTAADTYMAAFAAGFPLVHEPGSPEAYNYSSGTSNLTCAAAQFVVGGGEAGMRAFLADELFTPIGMSNVRADFDDAGTFVASSYVYATPPRLRPVRPALSARRRRTASASWPKVGSTMDVRRSRPTRRTSTGRTGGPTTTTSGRSARTSFEGQRIVCVPALDLVLVRLGRTHADRGPTLDAHLMEIVNLFR